NEFHKSINEIEYLLDKLEGQEEREKGNMINDLSNKLTELNGEVLCEGCRGKKITNKLSNILNELSNKSYSTINITRLSLSESLETSKMIENCTSCKNMIGKYYFYGLYKPMNEIEYLLDKLEQEGQEERERMHMVDDLSDKLIKIDG